MSSSSVAFSDGTTVADAAAAFVEMDGRKARLDRVFRKYEAKRAEQWRCSVWLYGQNSVLVGHRIQPDVNDADRRFRRLLPGRNDGGTAIVLVFGLMALLVAGIDDDGRGSGCPEGMEVVPAVDDVVSATSSSSSCFSYSSL